MLIVGAKGFAKEILEIVHQLNYKPIVFFDDITKECPDTLFGYKILRNNQSVIDFFAKYNNQFTIGIGNPQQRKQMYDMFVQLGGKLTSTISLDAQVGSFGVTIEEGCNVLAGAILSNAITIGKGCIIYYHSVITHDVTIGDFVEISPGVNLLGRCKVGSFSQIGSNSTILPDVEIGKNVIIGAGSTVTKDIPDNSVAVGMPAKVIKEISPLIFQENG